MDICDEHQQAGEFLTSSDETKIRCGLYRIDSIGSRVRETNHFGFGRLRLEHKRGEIGGVDRRSDAADHRSTVLLDHCRSVLLQRMTESVVGSYEEPTVSAFLLHDRSCGALG